MHVPPVCSYICTAGLTWPLPPEPTLAGRLLDLATGRASSALMSLILFAVSMTHAEAAALLATALAGLASLVWVCQRWRQQREQQRSRAAAQRPGAVAALQAQLLCLRMLALHPRHSAPRLVLQYPRRAARLACAVVRWRRDPAQAGGSPGVCSGSLQGHRTGAPAGQRQPGQSVPRYGWREGALEAAGEGRRVG